ncbi:MAG TPA: hypothetical protein PKY88_07905 [Anaerohalosphaeraceae bacterium]|nr:hypothetical protein [Anaerohalosphaeraceae bacterium]
MSWFESRSTKEKKSALKNAVAVMMSDGEISDSELAMLAVICRRLGLNLRVLKEILKNPEKIHFVVPRDNQEKIFQLIDIVFMMMADGKVDDKEMNLCKAIASGFSFNPAIIDRLLTAITESIQKGNDRSQTAEAVLSIL